MLDMLAYTISTQARTARFAPWQSWSLYIPVPYMRRNPYYNYNLPYPVSSQLLLFITETIGSTQSTRPRDESIQIYLLEQHIHSPVITRLPFSFNLSASINTKS